MATLHDVTELARAMNVSDEELVRDARRIKYGVESLNQLDDFLCDCVITSMRCLEYVREEDPNATLDDIYEDEEDEDDFDLERQMDKWEVQYLDERRREEAARARNYQDYCERKYGYDYS